MPQPGKPVLTVFDPCLCVLHLVYAAELSPPLTNMAYLREAWPGVKLVAMNKRQLRCKVWFLPLLVGAQDVQFAYGPNGSMLFLTNQVLAYKVSSRSWKVLDVVADLELQPEGVHAAWMPVGHGILVHDLRHVVSVDCLAQEMTDEFDLLAVKRQLPSSVSVSISPEGRFFLLATDKFFVLKDQDTDRSWIGEAGGHSPLSAGPVIGTSWSAAGHICYIHREHELRLVHFGPCDTVLLGWAGMIENLTGCTEVSS